MMCLEKGILLASLSLLAACDGESKETFSLVEATISDIQNAVKSGEASCRDVVEGYINRIDTYDQAMGINAITVINPNALEKADGVDRAIQNNEALPDLFCVPLLIKDNSCHFGKVLINKLGQLGRVHFFGYRGESN